MDYVSRENKVSGVGDQQNTMLSTNEMKMGVAKKICVLPLTGFIPFWLF